MKLKKFDKRYLPMLWIGLGIWLTAMLVSLIMEWMGCAPDGQESLMEMGKDGFARNPISMVMLLCVLQPIMEEIGFRLWGVGKKKLTILCLIVMALFSISEIGVLGVIFVAAIVVVMRVVKDPFARNWANTLLSSTAFALCHISGFGGFSLGMVLGLLDIFGMAMVMCWLVLNIGFWASALLHVLNNSLALLLPLIFLPDPVYSEWVVDMPDGQPVTISTSLTPVHAFADNRDLDAVSHHTPVYDSSTTEYVLAGEPAQIAMRMLMADHSSYDYHIDWRGKGYSMEERIRYVIRTDRPCELDPGQMLDFFLSDVHAYYELEDSLTFDTTEVTEKQLWLKYPDGSEVEFSQADVNDRAQVESWVWMMGEYEIISTAAEGEGDSIRWEDTFLPADNPMSQYMKKYSKIFNKILPAEPEFRDLRQQKKIMIH